MLRRTWLAKQATFTLVLLLLSNADFFATSRGHDARGPPRMSSDDIICIIHRANTPFLIWKDTTSSDAKPICNLVGECYLHGMMDGKVQEIVLTSLVVMKQD